MFLGNIYFAISKTCNLKCSYCYVSKENKNQKASDDKVYNSFKNFVEKLVKEKAEVNRILFHGAEPTMVSADTYVKMIELYKKEFPKLHGIAPFGMQTNGTRLEEFIEKLSPKDIGIGVSLDGWEEYNDTFRGDGVFQRATKNIRFAKEKGFYVSVLTVLSKPLMKQKHKLLTFINDMASIGVKVMLKPIHTEDESLSVHNEDGCKFGKWITEQGLQKYTQSCDVNLCDKYGNDCYFFEFDLDGLVYSCNKAYMIGGDFANWHEESFEEIVAKRVPLYHGRKTHEDCVDCKYVTHCLSGCPSDRVNGKAVDCFIKRGVWDNE